MLGKSKSSGSLVLVHLFGGAACISIAAGAIFFAGSSISNRRGVFLNARHELANTKGLLNDSLTERSKIELEVLELEEAAKDQLKLLPIKTLNARTVEIVALAEVSGILIDSLQPGERISGHRVPVLALEFKGQASAESVFAFFERMRVRMPDIHIQRVDLVSADSDTSMVQLSLGLYWFIDPDGKGE